MRQLHAEFQGLPCELCEQRLGVALHHKKFRSQSGDDSRENLIWLCKPCHDFAHGL